MGKSGSQKGKKSKNSSKGGKQKKQAAPPAEVVEEDLTPYLHLKAFPFSGEALCSALTRELVDHAVDAALDQELNEKAVSFAVESCFSQMFSAMLYTTAPLGVMPRDDGAMVYEDPLPSEPVAPDSWANTSVPARDVDEALSPKRVSAHARQDRKPGPSKANMEPQTPLSASRRLSVRPGVFSTSGRSRSRLLLTPGLDEGFAEHLGSLFASIDATGVGAISVLDMHEFLQLQPKSQARMTLPDLVEELQRSNILSAFETDRCEPVITREDFIRFLVLRVKADPSITYDVYKLPENPHGKNVEGARELRRILAQQAEQRKKNQVLANLVDGLNGASAMQGNRHTSGKNQRSDLLRGRRLPELVRCHVSVRDSTRPGLRPSTAPAGGTRPHQDDHSTVNSRFTARSRTNSVSARLLRFQAAEKKAFDEDPNVQDSVVRRGGFSPHPGVTLVERDSKTTPLRPIEATGGRWPLDRQHMSKHMYDRFRQGLPEYDERSENTAHSPEAEEAWDGEDGDGDELPEESEEDTEKNRQPPGDAKTAWGDEQDLAKLSQQGGHQRSAATENHNGSTQGNPVRGAAWLLDDEQQETLKRLMKKEQELIGEVKSQRAAGSQSVPQIPSQSARMNREKMKARATGGKNSRMRPLSSGGRRPVRGSARVGAVVAAHHSDMKT